MVVLAALALLLVVGACPNRLRNRVSCPFVKTLPQKLGTRPAKMYPFLFPTPFRHRRNPTVLLHLFRTGITIAVRTQSRQQAWRQRRSGSRKRPENEKIWMSFRRLRNLAVQSRDPLQQSAQQSCDHLHYQPFRFDHGSMSNRWHGLADPLHAPLRQLSCRPRRRRKNFLTSAGELLCNSSNEGQCSKNSHASLVSSFANHSRICGKYTFKYPLRRLSCAVFSSTSLRRSSTRFCTRRVASLSGVKRRSLSRCCNNRSSSRSASRGSSLAPDGYSASRMLDDIVDGTGYRCRHSYLQSMNTSAPFTCSTATAIAPCPNRRHSSLTQASTTSGLCSSSPVSRGVELPAC